MRTLLLALALSSPAWAACAGSPCGLIIPTGGATASVSTANNMLGSTDMRLEGRLYGQDWASGSSWGDFLQVGNFKLSYLAGPVGALYWALPATSTATGLVCTLTGQTDVKFRIMMNATDDVASIEVYTTEDNVQVCSWSGSITAYQSSGTISAAGISVGGDADVTGSLGFLRWYSSTVPIGTVIPVAVASAAPLGDWEFNSQTLADTSGVSPNQDMSGTVTYSDEPKFSPSCSVTGRMVQNTGTTFSPSGDNSIPLNGSLTLTYSWAVVTGSDSVSRAGVTLSNGTTANPTSSAVTGFGSMNFELTVTDSDMASTSCVSHNGVVSYNSVGVIDSTFSGLTSLQQSLVGPMIAYGQNPWAFGDEASETEADLQASNLVDFYTPFWDVAASGTVSFTSGSAAMTGTGTLKTTVDASNKVGVHFTGTDGLEYYAILGISSCASETACTLAVVYPASPDSPWPAAPTTMDWFAIDASGGATYSKFANGGSPFNYYDNQLAAQVLYWRSGIDEFWELQETIFTYWAVEYPRVSRFYLCTQHNWPTSEKCTDNDPGRSWSATGPSIRAVTAPTNIIPGLRNGTWAESQVLLGILIGGSTTRVGDIRAEGYWISGDAHCALVETDGTAATACKDQLVDLLPYLAATRRTLDTYAYWPQFFYTESGGGAMYTSYSSIGGGGSIDCTGSTCTKTGGTAWDASLVNQIFAICDLDGGVNIPADNSVCEAEMWFIDSIDTMTQTITLDHTVGTLSGKGFIVGALGQFAAWAAPIYGHAMWAQALYTAALALDGYDAMSAATYRQYAHEAMQYVMNKGMVPDLGGWYNAMMLPGITTPFNCTGSANWKLNTACGGGDAGATRSLIMEMGRACWFDWQSYHDTDIFDACTTWYAQAFAKYPSDTGYDGTYLEQFEPTGFYVSIPAGQSPPAYGAPKWFGQLGGYTGTVAIWPAVYQQELLSYTTPRVSGAVRFSGAVRIQ